MNARHAAALALVGWYLMVPPVSSNGTVDSAAPLRNWWHIGTYNSGQECQMTLLSDWSLRGVDKRGWQGSVEAAKKLGHNPTQSPEELLKRIHEETCVKDDDRRLAK
jgi:hypothetical protein